MSMSERDEIASMIKAGQKQRQQVHLVVDCEDNPGRVYAVFAAREDAEAFVGVISLYHGCEVESRTLYYGQPPHQGFNR